MLEIILFSLLIMIASLAGVFSVWKKAGDLIEKNLHFLVSFSAGVFLVISYELIVESLHLSESNSSPIFWFLVGMVGIWFIFKLVPEFHDHEHGHSHDHPHDNEDNKKNNKINPKRMILSDSIHNIGDGILIASAFSISSIFGAITVLGIFIHELVQEVSEFFVLKNAGYSIKKSLVTNFTVSSTILIGSVGGFLLLDSFSALEMPLLAISGGAFLIVVLQDLIPHSVRDSISTKHYIKHILLFVIGLSVMFFIGNQFSHSHENDKHEHEDTHELHEEEHEGVDAQDIHDDDKEDH
jgi:zinc and cadmium transporter